MIALIFTTANAAAQTPITTWEELHNMRGNLAGDYLLMNDLGPLDTGYDTYASTTANGGLGWEPIGTTSTRFTGQFDGNGFAITGLVINRTLTSSIGFFGAVGGGAILSNIRLEDATVHGNNAVGGLVGNMNTATITNSHVSGLINGGTASNGYDIGGLVGATGWYATTQTLVLSSSSSATVSGHGGVGGIIGRMERGALIEESHFTGTLAPRPLGSGIGMIAGYAGGHIYRSYGAGVQLAVITGALGGIAGDLEDHGAIVDSYTVSDISGNNWVAGLAGRVFNPGFISRSFSAGVVQSPTSNKGGAIAQTFSTTPVVSTYWNSEINDPALNSVGNGPSDGITGLTTAEMKYPHSGGAYAGWNFDTVWADGSTMYNDGYPYLQWQTQTYTVEYTAGPGGFLDTSAEPATRQRIPGARSSITAIPDTGYSFTQWSDGNLNTTRTDISINGDIAVSAQFSLNEYELTYSAGPNGNISGISTQNISHGSDGSAVTAVPNAGYTFIQWDDASVANPRIDTNVTADAGYTATFADITPPVSSILPPASATHVGATLSLDYTIVELGSGLDEVELYVRVPGSPTFAATGITTNTLSGTFVYTGVNGSGLYEFATAAVDNDTNAEAAPTAAEASILWNLVENGPFTMEVTSADFTTTHPMTNDINIIITIEGATPGGTITVTRILGDNGPGGELDTDKLLNEYLNITGQDLGTGWTATITWNFDPDNAAGIDGLLDTVFQYDGTTFVNQTPITPGANPIVIGNVTSFGDYYAGDANSNVADWQFLRD